MTLKKLAALALALVLVLSVSVTALAADDTYTGSGNTNATNVAGNTQIPITKSIIFFNKNTDTDQVYEPNIKFKYTVEPVDIADGSEPTVTDAGDTTASPVVPPVTAKVHKGPAGGVTGTEIEFKASNAVKSASPTGVEVEEAGSLGLDITKFSKPGVYRYKITEHVEDSTNVTGDKAALVAVGLTDRDDHYINTRYLDVYIHYNSTSGDLEMYGAVIFVTHGNATAGTEGKDSITTSTEKTTGFQPGVNPGSGTPSNYTNDVNVDKYTTYDFTVKKTVSGSMADKNHQFPFYVSISNTITGAKYTYIDAPGTGSGAGEIIAAAAITKGSDSPSSALKLKDGEYVKFVGVPSSQGTDKLAVVLKEFNDTYDEYTASTSATNGTLSIKETNGSDTDTTGKMNVVSGSMLANSFDIFTSDVAAQILTINNNLTEISPTGYVARIAPYALMLIGGVTLFIILAVKRRKNEEEEA